MSAITISIQRKWLIIGGIVVGLILAVICVLTLLGPSVGNVYSTTIMSAPLGAGGGGAFPEEAAAPQAADGGRAVEGQFPPVAGEAVDAEVLATAVYDNRGQTIERLIIRTGSVTVAVEDTIASRQAVEDMVAQMAGEGAFVVSTNEYGGYEGGSPYIDITIRVPAERFDEVMDALAGMAAEGTVPTRSESASDVTEEFVDLDARLQTLEAARDRLLQIMSEAQNTQDLLLAEQQLTQREADIEAIQGRIQYLQQSAALSSITISLQPYILAQPVDTSWRPAETVREAVDILLRGLRNFADIAIIFVIATLPWLVVLALVVYLVYRFIVRPIVRRRRGAG